MEEMMLMMRISSTTSSPETTKNIEATNSIDPITTSTCPSWKLYENPFYNSHQTHQNQPQQCQISSSISSKQQQVHHCLHLPPSARKLAASFWDLTFFKPVMEPDMDCTQAQIIQLKAEIEYERKARKKLESLNKRLARDLGEERRAREAIERVCEELAKEISFGKSEIMRMRKEIDEERKMLRMAEVLREERVQMKFAEARIVFEEKLLELEGCKHNQSSENSHFKIQNKIEIEDANVGSFSNLNNNVITENAVSSGYIATSRSVVSSMAVQKRASPEPENPHIKRGIKGFVEFPRVVRAIGSKSRHWGTKVECQKAQLRILLKQKSPIRSNTLIMS